MTPPNSSTFSRRLRTMYLRGSFKYPRSRGRLSNMIVKSTASILGAFLIHVTLGTIYTLSNINSYLTSYMRKHGSPTATYGGSVWISSIYAIGQGFSMVLGGYIERRYSARLACILGCLTHSGSILLTSWSVSHGYMATLMTYGFLPGFGCGLAYMTPMSNGFGWFPSRRGLVAGIILSGFGIGTFVFNIAQTAYVNPNNLSPPPDSDGYFTQDEILDRVPQLFLFIGTIYATMQFIGCCLLFKPPSLSSPADYEDNRGTSDGLQESLVDNDALAETSINYGQTDDLHIDTSKISCQVEIAGAGMSFQNAIRSREFIVLFFVYGITTQGVLFVNSMLKEYGQMFIKDDRYLAWTGSMASIANALGRLVWGLLIDRYSFTQLFTAITIIFGSIMFLMPFEFILSSKKLYLLGALGLFGSFSGWMACYPVHLSRVFGRTNSGMVYGLIFISQACGSIVMALGSNYMIDNFNRFVPFHAVVVLEVIALVIYFIFYPKKWSM